MNFVFNITTPKNTPETSKVITSLPVVPGRVEKVEIQFPAGAQGLHHLHINRAVHQVWPANAEANYIGDEQIIVIPANYGIKTPPYQFESHTWNLDDTYDHLVIIRMDIMPEVPEETITPEMMAVWAAEREAV